MGITVWILLTAALWFLCVAASNAVEALVPRYGARLSVMLLVGTTIGAFASAVGYAFFALAVFLFIGVWRTRRKIAVLTGDPAIATKYALPAAVLVVAATIASYAFSIEICAVANNGCERLFFDRIYTPPHLAWPLSPV